MEEPFLKLHITSSGILSSVGFIYLIAIILLSGIISFAIGSIFSAETLPYVFTSSMFLSILGTWLNYKLRVKTDRWEFYEDHFLIINRKSTEKILFSDISSIATASDRSGNLNVLIIRTNKAENYLVTYVFSSSDLDGNIDLILSHVKTHSKSFSYSNQDSLEFFIDEAETYYPTRNVNQISLEYENYGMLDIYIDKTLYGKVRYEKGRIGINSLRILGLQDELKCYSYYNRVGFTPTPLSSTNSNYEVYSKFNMLIAKTKQVTNPLRYKTSFEGQSLFGHFEMTLIDKILSQRGEMSIPNISNQTIQMHLDTVKRSTEISFGNIPMNDLQIDLICAIVLTPLYMNTLTDNHSLD